MGARVFLTLDVETDSVTPHVAVMSNHHDQFSGGGSQPVEMATVRALTHITNRVLDFAEGIKS